GVDQVVHRIDALQVHGQAFQAVGDLAGHRIALDAADLLEVGELGDFHAVEPDFPPQAPGAEGRRFPVVLDEADVMHQGVHADAAQRFQVELLDVRRVRLEHYLELVIVLQTVGVLAVAAIGGPAGRLHIGGVPGFRTDGAQEGGGVEGAGAHFHIVGLQDHAALFGPELLQGQDQVLEGAHGGRSLAHGISPVLMREEAFRPGSAAGASANVQSAEVYPIGWTSMVGNADATLCLVYRRSPLHRLPRSGVGRAAARSRRAVRTAGTGDLPGRAVLAYRAAPT